MAKNNKNSVKKDVSTTPEKANDKVIPIDQLKADFAKKLLGPLNLEGNMEQFAAVTFDVLRDEFGELCTMSIHQNNGGFYRIKMNNKNTPEKAVAQIEITIQKDGRYNIHLNDYEHYEDFYFYGDKFTT